MQYEEVVKMINISIHTPLAGSDNKDGCKGILLATISIHTPLAGSDDLKSFHFQ